MRIVNLASGSKGNVTFFEAGGVRILIDVGLSLKELTLRLAKVGEKIENIDAILVTHEHSDHIRGFMQVMKKTKAHAYVHKTVSDYLGIFNDDELMARTSLIEPLPFSIGEVRVLPVSLPHDSRFCLGYILYFQGKQISIITDLGYVPMSILEAMVGSDLVYIESNHDRRMLANCAYPRIIKQRIASERGHLSNEQAAAAIVELAKKGTKYFVLSHISQNSNTLENAFLCVSRVLENNGFKLEKDVYVRYSRQDMPGNNFYFEEH